MNRMSMPIVSLFVSVLALLPVAVSGQTSQPSTPAVFAERAELAAPLAFSSSSISSAGLFDAAAQSSGARSVSSQAPQGSRLPFSGIAIGVKFGLAGVGFDVATPLKPGWINLRGGASFFSYNPNLVVDNININGSIKFQNAAAMVDFFPFHGRFRVSGGATVYNNTGLTAALTVPAGQSFTLGSTTYYSQPGNPIVGTGVFTFGGNQAVPRVTIGTGNMLPRRGRFTFESEVGVQFFSAPTVVYNFSGNGCQNYNGVTYSNCGPVSQTSVTQEQNTLQNDLIDLKYFPIVSIGLSYKIH